MSAFHAIRYSFAELGRRQERTVGERPNCGHSVKYAQHGPMKWLVAIGSLLLAVGATYYLIFVDRTFRSYDGAKEGMAIYTAVEQLRVEGWTLLSSSSVVKRSDCTENEGYYFVQMRSPDYVITLAVDADCEVSSIAQKIRGIEL